MGAIRGRDLATQASLAAASLPNSALPQDVQIWSTAKGTTLDAVLAGISSNVFTGATNLSGTYNGDVVVKSGAATITGTLVIFGKLEVQGQILNPGGFAITVWGDVVSSTGGINLSATTGTANQAVTIYGSIRTLGTFNVTGATPSPASGTVQLASGSLVVLTAVTGTVSPTGTLHVNTGSLAGQTFPYTGGTSNQATLGAPYTSGLAAGNTVTLQGAAPTVAVGLQMVNGLQVNHTTLTIHGDLIYVGAVQLGGGAANIEGNNLVVNGSVRSTDANGLIDTTGQTSPTQNAGSGGSITVRGDVIATSINTSGGNTAGVGGFQAGSSGSISILGSFYSSAPTSVNAQSWTTTKTITYNAGSVTATTASSFETAGNCGSCVIVGNCIALSITAIGGSNAAYTSGGTSGGLLEIGGNFVTTGGVTLNGGSGTVTNGGSGGAGGNFFCAGNAALGNSTISSIGGNGFGFSAGGGGQVFIFGNCASATINTSGGVGATFNSTLGFGGQGGPIGVLGFCYNGTFTASGGVGTNQGGIGASIVLNGGFVNAITANGGNSSGANAGGAGALTVNGFTTFNGQVNFNGGNATAAFTNGAGGQININSGANFVLVSLLDGTGGSVAPTGQVQFNFNGPVQIGLTLTTSVRSGGVFISPGSNVNKSASLVVQSLVGTTSLVNDDRSYTTAALTTQGNMYVYFLTVKRWFAYTGVST